MLDSDLGVNVFPFIDLRHESAAAGSHRLRYVYFVCSYRDDLMVIVLELIRYIEVKMVVIAGDVRKYKGKDLRFA